MRIWPDFQSGISRLIWMFSAHTALTWFMFFSGYGMSLKRIRQGEHLIRWKNSVFKIYLPCLFVNTVAFLLYSVLPEFGSSPEEYAKLMLNPNIHELHHLTLDNIFSLLLSFFSGNGSWYVGCIIMFYSIFYFASYIAEKKQWRFTLVLAFFFLVYFVIAYIYFGKAQAHYYRYCWTFLFGHAVATKTKLSITIATIFLITIGMENWVLHMSYVIAMIGICLVSVLNTKYVVYGKYMLWLGGISYLFYLSHESISYVLITYLHVNSVIAWVGLSVIVASSLNIMWKRIGLRN